MRFEDLAWRLEDRRKAEQEQWDRTASERAQAQIEHEASRRSYLIGYNQTLEFEVDLLVRRLAQGMSRAEAVAASIRIHINDWQLYGPEPSRLIATGFSSASLARALEATRHIERWVAGELAELRPSGEWTMERVAESGTLNYCPACDSPEAM